MMCRYFARGNCLAGSRCTFSHSVPDDTRTERAAETAIEPDGIRQQYPPRLLDGSTWRSRERRPDVRPQLSCKFESLPGGCRKADCLFLHAGGQDLRSTQVGEVVRPASDAPFQVPCRFAQTSSGCQKPGCPYQHPDGIRPAILDAAEGEEHEEQDFDSQGRLIREIAGATVTFDDYGGVYEVSLPSDFSVVQLLGLDKARPREQALATLSAFDVGLIPVEVHSATLMDSAAVATIKVKDPDFARQFLEWLSGQHGGLTGHAVFPHSAQASCRKVNISWYKATKTVWLNFGSRDIAQRVADQFKTGTYTCIGRRLSCSEPKSSVARGARGAGPGSRGTYSHNTVPWTVTLTNVPGDATKEDLQKAIRRPADRPRHVELGKAAYKASTAEVSAEVRALLEEHGYVEDFRLIESSSGKRSKSYALFQADADARAAGLSLNGKAMQCLGGGKLTASLIQSVKIKVALPIYEVVKDGLEAKVHSWRQRGITFHAYEDSRRRFVTVRLNGNDSKLLAAERRVLDGILDGTPLVTDGKSIWHAELRRNGTLYQQIMAIGPRTGTVITRDRIHRRLLIHGPTEKHSQVLSLVLDLVDNAKSTDEAVQLNDGQLSHTPRGGVAQLDQAYGKDVENLDVVTKRLTIGGDQAVRKATLPMLSGESAPAQDRAPTLDPESCPICFCEPEDPVTLACNHTYCLECLEETCKMAASQSKAEYKIRCQGNDGSCTNTPLLRDLRDHISSAAFEETLSSSFSEYLAKNTELFRYCPTPDCPFIYRCDTPRRSQICGNCLESICTTCHANHGGYTCAEHKDIASGGYEALAKLKKELNIKDCPKCTTPIEKTYGCNHMECAGCKAHICWVCLAFFDAGGKCYEHMREAHGRDYDYE